VKGNKIQRREGNVKLGAVLWKGSKRKKKATEAPKWFRSSKKSTTLNGTRASSMEKAKIGKANS